jgi:hypothetical protein
MDFYGFCMYIFCIMQSDTSILRISFSRKGDKALGREWTGISNNEPYARLYYIVDGEAEIWHHMEKFVLIPGQLYLIPPKSCMRFRCMDHFTVVWVHFNLSLYGYLDLFESQNFSFVHIPEDIPYRH